MLRLSHKEKTSRGGLLLMAEGGEVGRTLPYCPSLTITSNPGSRGQQEEESWVADCPETGRGSAEPSPQIHKGQGGAACLPTPNMRPRTSARTLSPMTWHSLLTVYNTRIRNPPPTLNRTPELDALQPANPPSPPGLAFSSRNLAPSTAISGNWCLTRLLLPILSFFLSPFLPAETLLSEREPPQSGARERQKLPGELGAKRG